MSQTNKTHARKASTAPIQGVGGLKRLLISISVATGALLGSAAIGQSCDPVLNLNLPESREYKFVDLSRVVNTAKDAPFWTRNYDALIPGTKKESLTSKVPFEIAKGANNEKNIMLMLGDNVRRKTIPFNDMATLIYFFGHTHANVPINLKHGEYIIHYEDETTKTILLDGRRSQAGWNIDDHCCNYAEQNTEQAKVAWRGAGAKPALIRELEWENPEPDKAIKEIEFVDYDQPSGTPGGERHPMLFAITYTQLMAATEVPPGVGGTSNYYWLEEDIDIIFSRRARPCILLTLYNEAKRFIIVAHINQATNIKKGMKELINKTREAGLSRFDVRAYVTGGIQVPDRQTPLECVRQSLIKELQRRRIPTNDKGFTPDDPIGEDTEAWAGFVEDKFFYCDKQEAKTAHLAENSVITKKLKTLPPLPYGADQCSGKNK